MIDWVRPTWGRAYLLAVTAGVSWLAWRLGLDSVAEVVPGLVIAILLIAFWWHWSVAFKPR